MSGAGKRSVCALVLTLMLAACETGDQPLGGVATYDALKRATDDCAAKGGTLTLKTMGDSQNISDYDCKGK